MKYWTLAVDGILPAREIEIDDSTTPMNAKPGDYVLNKNLGVRLPNNMHFYYAPNDFAFRKERLSYTQFPTEDFEILTAWKRVQ